MEKEFEKEILERLIRIETKLDDYDNIKTKAEEARATAISNKRRIEDIEDKIKWLSRTIARDVDYSNNNRGFNIC